MTNDGAITQAVLFDESKNSFEPLFTIRNKEADFQENLLKLERKRTSLDEFSEYPRPIDDMIETK